MKSNKFWLVIGIWALISAGCSDEDDYTKYLEGGEIYYPGKIENAVVLAGKERVLLYGLFVSDPKVTQCAVYWNIGQDSVIFPVVRDNFIDTLNEIITVEEGIHNFEFYTMDDEGNRSVVVNATGQSFGSKYQDQLYNRPIIDTLYSDGDNQLEIQWGGIDLSTGAYQTEVQYNLGTNTQSLRVDIADTLTTIDGYDGTGVKYRTFFRPTLSSIDQFWTEFVTLNQ